MKEALGLIEAVGLAAAIEAADTCLKAANVNLIGYELTKGGGYVTVKISGDVGAVNAAVTAATAAAMKVRGVYSSKVIPRPSEALGSMVNSLETVGRIMEPVAEAPIEASETQDGDPETDSVPADDSEGETLEEAAPEPNDVLQDVVPISADGSEESSDTTCNICHNPACGRLKGEPRTKCITYKR